MAKKIILAQMRQRRDTRENWASINPVLLSGELGIVTDDPNLYKVGDGTSRWNDLPFRGFDGTLVHDLGESINAAMSQKGVTDIINGLHTFLTQEEYDALEKKDDKLYFILEE